MKLLRYTAFLTMLLTITGACQSGSQHNTQAEEQAEITQVANTEAEWEILFDGSHLDHWRNYLASDLSDKWQIEDGTLTLTGKGGGDIITQKQYESFELQLDWKISECGNSGIFFHVVEHDTLPRVFHSGPEVQILDNTCHPDAKIPDHRAGDNYDMHPVSEETVKSAGEWNAVRLIVDKGHVEQWLNGTKVVEYELNSPEWEELYQKSKFAKWPMYGRAGKGHIALQDHGDKVWFRNIKIKEL